MRDNRALLRALRIERAMGKLYFRKLRELIEEPALSEFRGFCRETVYARDATDQMAAKVTAEAGDA